MSDCRAARGGTDLDDRLVLLQRWSRPAWLYIGDRNTTRMHVGTCRNSGRAELLNMLRVVMGSGDVTASELPREDLVLCDDSGRVAR
ncbi:hypothetical protein E2562_018779 [Oryza meyeriana var. granulata]|uniref:Uncharacterized protein n=1 Tax=Oryza meyeriana var. granulata TaxID=110450 RepID=A0A6G1EX60_9ORYZ|nr:hypothetical protein E2562_018779 [Oryza meyeriana var. granulata]